MTTSQPFAMPHRRLLTAAAALALAGCLTVSPATSPASQAAAGDGPTVTPIATKLLSPLSVAEAPDGTRYWTDNFAAVLWKQAPGGTPAIAYHGSPKFGVESVSADGGVLRFTTGAPDNSRGRLLTLDASGKAVQVADLYAHERKANPDGKYRYGLLNTPATCRDRLPKGFPKKTYAGVVESHPYATATAPDGTTYVADAGANSVLAVTPSGKVSTLAVVKPAKVEVTKFIADGIAQLPHCTLGKKIALESVPTDVEVGPDGKVYVTSFGGGPEDGSLGFNGRISRIDPVTGRVSTISQGYKSLAGIAVSPQGDIYVSDLMVGAILTIKTGHKNPRTFVEVPFPAAVESTSTGLLASIDALPGKKPHGQVVLITP